MGSLEDIDTKKFSPFQRIKFGSPSRPALTVPRDILAGFPNVDKRPRVAYVFPLLHIGLPCKYI